MTRESRKMRAIEISKAGGPDVLREVTLPIPEPGRDEVLIRVRAAGVNGHDLHQRSRGSHPLNPGETPIPGLEAAGEIAATGSEVSRWRVGDSVCALLRGGGYAEYVVAKDGNCLPLPDGYNWAEAAALPETSFTVWSNVIEEAKLQAGESFLMNGATSGIGVTAIQILSALGYTVFATAGGAEKCDVARKLGATCVIDYQTQSFDDEINETTGGRGVDVILEIVSGDYIQKDLSCLAHGGRLVIIGAARGLKVDLDLRPVVVKNLHITGSLLRPRSNGYKERIAGALLDQVWPLYSSRRIEPIIDNVYPLADAAEAHRRLESRKHVGKVILTVQE